MPGWRARIHYDHEAGPPVPWRRAGYALPRRWQAQIEAPGLPYLVELDFSAGDDGPSCRAIRLMAREDGPEINPREIRSVPVGRCIQFAISAAALREERTPQGIRYSYGGEPYGTYSSAGVEAFRLARPTDVRTKDARLREVAAIYKAAEDTGKPTRAVADELPTSYSTAARLVMEARRRGFLPPSRRSQSKGHER